MEILNLNSFDHTHYLMLCLSLLILGNFLKLKIFNIAAIGLLIFDFFKFSNFQSDDILHYSLDLILLAGLSLISSMLNKNFFRFSYIPISILAFLLIHNVYSGGFESADSSKELQLDESNELLVLFNSKEDRISWIEEHHTKYEINFPLFNPEDHSGEIDDFAGLNIPDNINALQAMRKLEKDPRIQYIELNELLELKLPELSREVTPRPTALASNDPLSNKQWSLNKMQKDNYYNLIQGKISAQDHNPVFIAILDTGTDANHEDLSGNFFSLNESYDTDQRGHGTHCAGIAAAITGNNIGIASLLPPDSPVKVSSVKVLNNFGFGSQKQIIDGMIEAVDKGASVISLSLGALTDKEKERAYTEAVEYAIDHNCIVVVAAGNSSADSQNYSPANIKGVITVSAINNKGLKASFANHLDNIEFGIYAPGESILSCFPKNKYETKSGTSMAAPYVAGFIGLLKYFDRSMTNEQAFQIIRAGADISSEGYPIINAEKSLEYFFNEAIAYQ